MAQPAGTGQFLVGELLHQPIELALGLDCCKAVLLAHDDSGRVIAAVLEAAQPLEEYGNDLAAPEIANNPTH